MARKETIHSPADDYLGYLKYSGPAAMDARKAAHALLGFDKALRHFLAREAPALRGVEFEIPVIVRPGSWEAVLPATAGQWALTALGAGATAYLTKAGTEMATHDFKEVGIGALFKKSLEGIQWTVKIGRHLGTLQKKIFSEVRWEKGNQSVGIPNDKKEYLVVPKNALDAFSECPTSLFSDIAAVIDAQRELSIGIVQDGGFVDVKIPRTDKHIFHIEEEQDQLFPELKHGKSVELDGTVTRGNENTNSLGFLYDDHILTCYPTKGSIVRFKQALFLKCRLRGVINRSDEGGGISANKPKIYVDEITPLEKEPVHPQLFAEDDNVD
ncbi:MAG: hypothetical protein PHS14_00890 [Elusimicrobia bacterium]|nr:hypothetical protein [Elusimicrobiota bacterium]